MKVFFEILKVEIFSRFIFEKYSHGNFNFFFYDWQSLIALGFQLRSEYFGNSQSW